MALSAKDKKVAQGVGIVAFILIWRGMLKDIENKTYADPFFGGYSGSGTSGNTGPDSNGRR